MRNIIAVVLLQSLFAVLARADVEDAELRHVLERAVRYEDNPHAAVSEIRYAIQVAGGNTNRVVSLMKQLIVEGTEDAETDMFYISEIGKYGTSSDLPFLYQKVTTADYCASATEAILRIEGLTTNSLTQIMSSLPDSPRGNKKSAYAWCRILDVVTKSPSGEPIRTFALSNAVQFVSRQTESADWLDRGLIRIEPPYRMSKRRLAALRSVQSLGVGEWQTNYIAQAIRELEAYPEANLPE
ncbi:MAG: hypothetical protein IKU71_03750 [Kiritimatiellae bacterium]|nr:hypothetical protein [Kiritimatiellia bacterium]